MSPKRSMNAVASAPGNADPLVATIRGRPCSCHRRPPTAPRPPQLQPTRWSITGTANTAAQRSRSARSRNAWGSNRRVWSTGRAVQDREEQRAVAPGVAAAVRRRGRARPPQRDRREHRRGRPQTRRARAPRPLRRPGRARREDDGAAGRRLERRPGQRRVGAPLEQPAQGARALPLGPDDPRSSARRRRQRLEEPGQLVVDDDGAQPLLLVHPGQLLRREARVEQDDVRADPPCRAEGEHRRATVAAQHRHRPRTDPVRTDPVRPDPVRPDPLILQRDGEPVGGGLQLVVRQPALVVDERAPVGVAPRPDGEGGGDAVAPAPQRQAHPGDPVGPHRTHHPGPRQRDRGAGGPDREPVHRGGADPDRVGGEPGGRGRAGRGGCRRHDAILAATGTPYAVVWADPRGGMVEA